MVPPTLSTYFYQVTSGRFTAGTQIPGFFKITDHPARIWQTGAKSERNGHQLISITYGARLVQ